MRNITEFLEDQINESIDYKDVRKKINKMQNIKMHHPTLDDYDPLFNVLDFKFRGEHWKNNELVEDYFKKDSYVIIYFTDADKKINKNGRDLAIKHNQEVFRNEFEKLYPKSTLEKTIDGTKVENQTLTFYIYKMN